GFEQACLCIGIASGERLGLGAVGGLEGDQAADRPAVLVEERTGELQLARCVQTVEIVDMGRTVRQAGFELAGLVLADECENHDCLRLMSLSVSLLSGRAISAATASPMVVAPDRMASTASMIGASTPFSRASRAAMPAVATPSAS